MYLRKLAMKQAETGQPRPGMENREAEWVACVTCRELSKQCPPADPIQPEQLLQFNHFTMLAINSQELKDDFFSAFHHGNRRQTPAKTYFYRV